MLPDAKIPLLIAQQIPALSPGMEQTGPVTQTIRTFTAYTKQLINKGQLQEVKKCFSMAGVLYRNGSTLLKNAIEDVFLYSISPFLEAQQYVKESLPQSLKHLRNQHLKNTLC